MGIGDDGEMTETSIALKHLIDLTDNKIKHLKDILDITCRQKEAITQQNIDTLTQYIDEKQEHIDKINGLDEEFEKLYNGIRSEFPDGGAEQGMAVSAEKTALCQKLKNRVREVYNIVKIVYEIERQNNENAGQAMEGLKEKIRGISAAKKGYNAYKSVPKMADGVFIDKKR